MHKELYNILLDNKKIGTTELEHSDAPMGVTFGQIKFDSILSGYDFFKSYCLTNGINILNDYPDYKLISTTAIPNLKVFTLNGIEIKSEGISIEGMDSDVFQITVFAI